MKAKATVRRKKAVDPKGRTPAHNEPNYEDVRELLTKLLADEDQIHTKLHEIIEILGQHKLTPGDPATEWARLSNELKALLVVMEHDAVKWIGSQCIL